MQRPLIGLRTGLAVGIAVGVGLSQPARADGAMPAGAVLTVGGYGDSLALPLSLKRSLMLTRAAYPGAGRLAEARRGGMLHLRLDPGLASHDTGSGALLPPAAQPGDARPADFPSSAEPVRAPAMAALLNQARFWVGQGREDLAEDALQKLLRIAPDNLAGLEMLARIQARRRLPDAVRQLTARMRRLQPDAPEVARVEALMRIDGSDSDALRRIRMLAREQRLEEAVAAMRSLYPQGPPTEETTLEYWSMVARAPNGRSQAREGMQALVRSEPDNLRYRLALDELLTARAPIDRPALARIIALTEVPAYAKQARAAWRRAMLALDDNSASAQLLRNYLALEKNDSAVQGRLDAMLTGGEMKRRPQADPYHRAQERLQAADVVRGSEIDLLNGEGLLRLRQRRHAEAETLFLRAARLDPARQARWQRMAGVARYWGLITQADAAAAARRFAMAEDQLREARALDPKEPAALLALGSLYLAQDRPGDAERSYHEVLAADPGNASAPDALVRMYLAQAQDDRLQQLVTQLNPAQRTALMPRINGARAGRLRTQADALVAAGSTAQAIMLLEEAIMLAPADPWLRYDLARLYVGRNAAGDDSRADRLFATLLQPAAPDPAALYAHALLHDTRDRRIEALQTLERIPASARERKIIELQRRLWVTQRSARAAALTASGADAAAVQLLRDTATAVGDDASLAPQVASALADLQATLRTRERNSGDAGIGLIDSLIGAGEIDAARQEIVRQLGERRAAAGGMTADDAASLASRLLDLKEQTAAGEVIDAALAATPDDARLLEQASQVAERDGRPDAAISLLQRSLATARNAAQDSRDTRGVGSRLHWLAGDDGAPGDPVAAVGPGAVPDRGIGLRIDAAPQGLPAGAAPPPSGPQVPHLRIELGRPPEQPANGSYRRLAELLDSRSTWLAGAVDNRSRIGSAGKSDYAYTELPFEVRAPWQGGSQVFAQAAVVRSSAGTLDLAAVDSAARFGSVLLCQPLCTTGAVIQTVQGLSLMAGIERDAWRADIGVTPLGFPITNIVGGVLKKGDIGAFSYSVDASRRALMGSVLSYAGARDPRTGAAFGGVLANGVRFGLSRDSGGAFGAWSALGLHRLTGTAVQANNRMQLMGGGYWRIINEDDRVLSLGMNAMLWRSSENAGEYTLGHGGYYSPQRFASVSLPLTFSARSARLSYTVRAALSSSRSSTAAADYFPTRPDLQTQALALAAGNGIDPRYGASTGHGVGRSLSAAIEYQMNPKLFVGGRFEIDRSSDYAPNRLLFYFRYNLDRSSARLVSLPPEPLLPASQY